MKKTRAISRQKKKMVLEENCRKNLEDSFNGEVELVEEIIYTAERIDENLEPMQEELTTRSEMTQTPSQPMFSVDTFVKDDVAIHFYTGLESYAKFLFVWNTLGPAPYCLTYLYFQIESVSVENQLFMTLMKLRRYTTNFEFPRLFFNFGNQCKKYCLHMDYFHIKAMERSKYFGHLEA